MKKVSFLIALVVCLILVFIPAIDPFRPIFSTFSYFILLPGRHFLFFLSRLPYTKFGFSPIVAHLYINSLN